MAVASIFHHAVSYHLLKPQPEVHSLTFPSIDHSLSNAQSFGRGEGPTALRCATGPFSLLTFQNPVLSHSANLHGHRADLPPSHLLPQVLKPQPEMRSTQLRLHVRQSLETVSTYSCDKRRALLCKLVATQFDERSVPSPWSGWFTTAVSSTKQPDVWRRPTLESTLCGSLSLSAC